MYMKYIDLLSVESLNRERERERKSVQMKVFLNDFPRCFLRRDLMKYLHNNCIFILGQGMYEYIFKLMLPSCSFYKYEWIEAVQVAINQSILLVIFFHVLEMTIQIRIMAMR